jgi:MHS family proline/betaine transporter-like MFS transporter
MIIKNTYSENGICYESQYTLTRTHRLTLGILSAGTFLEYFDVMLYAHMAFFLNDLFFPDTNPHFKVLLTSAAFCSTYVFRPLGALFFGWVGDIFGRKNTISFTMLMMAFCCGFIALSPTYDKIGIQASIGIICCRIVQGICSIGEIVGALIYLTETVKLPARYFAVATIPVFKNLGGVAALIVGFVIFTFDIDWRYAFGFGAIVASLGVVVRTGIRETPDFIEAAEARQKNTEEGKILINKEKKHSKKTSISLFLMECVTPLLFYLVFIYCGEILKVKFNYTTQQIMKHNLCIGLIALASNIMRAVLCKYFHPLVILKYILVKTAVIFMIFPFAIESAATPMTIALLQIGLQVFSPSPAFAASAIYKNFPIFHRFRSTTFLYAISHAVTNIFLFFVAVYLIRYTGSYGLLMVLMLTLSGSVWGLRHFLKLEKENGISLTPQRQSEEYSLSGHLAYSS